MGLLQSIADRFLRSGNSVSSSTRRGSDPRHDLGRQGERLAARELRRQGYKVLYRNFRPAAFSQGEGGEIDLVCRDGEVLVFVEVKTRRSVDHGTPLETITPAQKERIITGAFAWLRMLNHPPLYFRFDVVEVMIQGKAASLRVVKNAFTLPENVRYQTADSMKQDGGAGRERHTA